MCTSISIMCAIILSAGLSPSRKNFPITSSMLRRSIGNCCSSVARQRWLIYNKRVKLWELSIERVYSMLDSTVIKWLNKYIFQLPKIYNWTDPLLGNFHLDTLQNLKSYKVCKEKLPKKGHKSDVDKYIPLLAHHIWIVHTEDLDQAICWSAYVQGLQMVPKRLFATELSAKLFKG